MSRELEVSVLSKLNRVSHTVTKCITSGMTTTWILRQLKECPKIINKQQNPEYGIALKHSVLKIMADFMA